MTIDKTIYNSSLKLYQEYHDKYNLDIEKSYNCTLKNPSSFLHEEIKNLKQIFEKINLSEWEDDVTSIFQYNINACISEYDTILKNIEDNFVSIEKQYELCFQELNSLKDNYTNLENEISSYPNSSHFYYNVTNPLTGEVSSEFDNSKFNSACSEWSSKCQDKVNKCEENKTCIDDCISKLNEFNMLKFEEIAILQNPVYKTTNFGNYFTMFGVEWATIADQTVLTRALRNSTSGSCMSYAKRYFDYVDQKLGNPEINSLKHIECKTKEDLLRIAYDELQDGRSTIIRVNGVGEVGQHYVYVAGVRSDADYNNLTERDFLIIDNDGRCFRQMNTTNSTNLQYRRVRRLLTGYESDLGRDHKYLYRIEVSPERANQYLARANTRELFYGIDWTRNYD